LDKDIRGAGSVIVNVVGGPSLTLEEIKESVSLVQEVVDEDVNIIFGAGIDETLDDEIRVTIIAAGFEKEHKHHPHILTRHADVAASARALEPIEKPKAASKAPSVDPAQMRFDEITPTRMAVDEKDIIPPFLARLKDKQ
jgi:cell division GTPase FtsZ